MTEWQSHSMFRDKTTPATRKASLIILSPGPRRLDRRSRPSLPSPERGDCIFSDFASCQFSRLLNQCGRLRLIAKFHREVLKLQTPNLPRDGQWAAARVAHWKRIPDWHCSHSCYAPASDPSPMALMISTGSELCSKGFSTSLQAVCLSFRGGAADSQIVSKFQAGAGASATSSSAPSGARWGCSVELTSLRLACGSRNPSASCSRHTGSRNAKHRAPGTCSTKRGDTKLSGNPVKRLRVRL